MCCCTVSSIVQQEGRQFANCITTLYPKSHNGYCLVTKWGFHLNFRVFGPGQEKTMVLPKGTPGPQHLVKHLGDGCDGLFGYSKQVSSVFWLVRTWGIWFVVGWLGHYSRMLMSRLKWLFVNYFGAKPWGRLVMGWLDNSSRMLMP